MLMSRSLNLGGAPIDTAGAVALIIAPMSWSVAAALTRKLPSAVFQSHELGSADARRRSVAGSHGRRAGRISQFSSGEPSRAERGSRCST